MRLSRRTVLQAAAAAAALPACQASLSSPPAQGAGPVAFGKDGLRAELDVRQHRLTIGGRTVGGVGLGVGQLNGPVALVALGERFYVVECGNHRVQAFDARGESVAVFDGFSYPAGLAVLGDRLVVADTLNARLVELDPGTGAQRVLTGAALSAPVGLAIDGERLLVADPGLRRVLELDASGAFVSALGEGWVLPRGLAVDGELTFVADAASAELAVLDRAGRRRDPIALGRGAGFVSLDLDGRLVVA